MFIEYNFMNIVDNLQNIYFQIFFLFSHLVPQLQVFVSSFAASISVISVAGSPSGHWIFIFSLGAGGEF